MQIPLRSICAGYLQRSVFENSKFLAKSVFMMHIDMYN